MDASFAGTALDDWRRLPPASVEDAYMPSRSLPDGDWRPFLERYVSLSEQARRVLPSRSDLVYADADPACRLDLYRPDGTGPVPVVVYFHGGYWQELSKEASAFAAEGLVAQGVALAVVGYPLAPGATLAAIVAHCRQAVAWSWRQAGALGLDRHRMVLAGSSAGAHLAAMAASPEGLRAGGLPMDALAGAVLVSGVHDLRPLTVTSVNGALGLDEAAAWSSSPLRLDWRGAAPIWVVCGRDEGPAFHLQSEAMADHLDAAGVPTGRLRVPGRNHFDVILDLGDPATPLGAITRALLHRAP